MICTSKPQRLEEWHPGVQAPDGTQAGSGSVNPRCVCVLAARFDGTLQAPGEARKRSQRNGSPHAAVRGRAAAPQSRRASSIEENSSNEGNSSRKQQRRTTEAGSSSRRKQQQRNNSGRKQQRGAVVHFFSFFAALWGFFRIFELCTKNRNAVQIYQYIGRSI